MSIREVMMYRVECDADGCKDSPQDESDFYAWADRSQALDEAANADWYVGEFGEFCFEHAPRCPCGIRIHGDPEDEDGLCEDCQEATVPA